MEPPRRDHSSEKKCKMRSTMHKYDAKLTSHMLAMHAANLLLEINNYNVRAMTEHALSWSISPDQDDSELGDHHEP